MKLSEVIMEQAVRLFNDTDDNIRDAFLLRNAARILAKSGDKEVIVFEGGWMDTEEGSREVTGSELFEGDTNFGATAEEAQGVSGSIGEAQLRALWLQSHQHMKSVVIGLNLELDPIWLGRFKEAWEQECMNVEDVFGPMTDYAESDETHAHPVEKLIITVSEGMVVGCPDEYRDASIGVVIHCGREDGHEGLHADSATALTWDHTGPTGAVAVFQVVEEHPA